MGWNYRNSCQFPVVSGLWKRWFQPQRTQRGTEEKLRPYWRRNWIFGRCRLTHIARFRIGAPEFAVVLDAIQGTVNDGFEFVEILHFAALGQAPLGFCGAKPRRTPVALVRPSHLMHFHQEGLDHKFLHTAGLPKDAL